MDEIKTFTDYCTGCGLCHSIRGAEIIEDGKGYPTPILRQDDISFCKAVCPCGGNTRVSDRIWGDYESIYYAWASDEVIRKRASSGGVLTTLCIYLLKNNFVDGIIQTCASASPVYSTETTVSKTTDDVIKCMGSRYSISSPLRNIKKLLQQGKHYAFVGKPCDVATLRSYAEMDDELKESIKYMFSFFCAGMPSIAAQHQLLSSLGTNESDCSRLNYRGDGWPGYASATCKDGSVKQMTYDESWGKILGREVRRICRFCFDGIGISADISCGDAWYKGKDNKPDFRENNGRNVVFLRTESGRDIFEYCLNSGEIMGNQYHEDDLQIIQKYQFDRRNTMISKIAALRICRKTYPMYSIAIMKELAKNASLRHHLSILKGTIKRCHTGKI